MKKSTFSIYAMLLMAGMVIQVSLFATIHTVLVGNYYFNPSSLNVTVGDTIKWQWVNGTHTTTSSSIPPGAATWDQPISSTFQVYEYKVTVAGTYNYVCTPHVAMGMIASFVANNPANLTVLPPSQNVPSTVGQTNFSVTSSGDWTALSDALWCTVTPSGSGNGTMVAMYSTNPGMTVRTANITVSLTGATPVIVQVIQEGSPAGISENNGTALHIYPNPAKDKVRISLGRVTDTFVRIAFTDLTGKTVMERDLMSNKEISINVSDLPRGCYFVKVLLGNETIVQQLVLTE